MDTLVAEDAVDLPPLTFAQLQSFAGLTRWGKQAAVTAALGKSQSQVSRDLAAMERALGGAVLFDRAARRPTDAGELVLEYAVSVLEGWQRLRSRLKRHDEGAGELALAVDPDVLSAVLLPVLSRLRERMPALAIRTIVCSAEDAVSALRSGAAHVGIVAGDHGGISARRLLQAELLAAVPMSSPLARRKRFSLAALRGQALLLPPEGSAVRKAAVAAFSGSRGLRVCDAGPGREGVLAAAGAGLGVGLVPFFRNAGDTLLRDAPATVVLRPTGAELRRITYSIAIRKGLAAGGPASALIRALMRAFYP
ncbi:MAG: LysR family transcriptional regulator [Planctomycetota bacterium]|nr:LysR family transcriptional regulator [Planctomycetota bacterium]